MPKDFETLLKQHRQKHFQELLNKIEQLPDSEKDSEELLLQVFNEVTDTCYSLISTYHSWLTENFDLIQK